MAGHPAIGTAYVLDRAGLIDGGGIHAKVTFEDHGTRTLTCPIVRL